ncbi:MULTISPECIES: hypothetical protein [Curtobacterium]|uniref:hypothetical protein n=1 Tax=Curtobacterium flaccumfaciens TaxID=2035 RepID=UPI003EE78A4C
MAKGISVRGTRATIYEPTERYRSWRIAYIDRATNARKTTSGGSSREEAEVKARQLSGEYVEGWAIGDNPPTLREATDLWIATNRPHWSSRTVDAYHYFGKKLTDLYGDRFITHISPRDMAKLDVSAHSRGQQEKMRSVVRGIFAHSSGWITKERADLLARGITLSGSSGSKRNPRVEKGDIPSSRMVAALVTTAYHTLQVGPLDDPERTTVEGLTGKKVRHTTAAEGRQRTGTARLATGMGTPDPNDPRFLDGLPLDTTNTHRRGMPKHYNHREARRTAETEELAGRYRQIGLATALGAGGGLRIGEILALRVRHFFTPDQVLHFFGTNWDRTRSNYWGKLEVSEQASQASRGAIWVTGTKGARKSRTVRLPAFLPNWHDHAPGTTREQINRIIPRFGEDPSLNLWQATDLESIELWRHGFTPLAYLLWDRLWEELWNHHAIRRLSTPRRIEEFRDLLLFPTRNRARAGAVNGAVQTDPTWTSSTRIVEGTGNYQSQTNFAKMTNPLYDFVEQEFKESPKHRTNRQGRTGWTHHGLRHWAVSTRIRAGVPYPVIAMEMGHKDSAFTLARYGHVIDPEGISDQPFEY